MNLHSFITLYIDELRPASEYNELFLNIYGRPLGQGEASRCLTKYFKSFGLTLSGSTSLRKVLIDTYWNALNDGTITQQGLYILTLYEIILFIMRVPPLHH